MMENISNLPTAHMFKGWNVSIIEDLPCMLPLLDTIPIATISKEPACHITMKRTRLTKEKEDTHALGFYLLTAYMID